MAEPNGHLALRARIQLAHDTIEWLLEQPESPKRDAGLDLLEELLARLHRTLRESGRGDAG